MNIFMYHIVINIRYYFVIFNIIIRCCLDLSLKLLGSKLAYVTPANRNSKNISTIKEKYFCLFYTCVDIIAVKCF